MPLETRQLDGGFAHEIVGLRLWEPLDAITVDRLRELWARHPVLVIRRQALSERELAEFSALFGPLERVVRTEWASPVVPEVGLISNLKDGQAQPIGGLGDGELQWHSDQSYMMNPATGAALYAVELPPEGGLVLLEPELPQPIREVHRRPPKVWAARSVLRFRLVC